MDKDISADIEKIKDPEKRTYVRVILYLLFGSGTVIAFLYKDGNTVKAQDLTDCKTEVRFWQGKADSFGTVVYKIREDQRIRLQEKEHIFDSIISLATYLNKNK